MTLQKNGNSFISLTKIFSSFAIDKTFINDGSKKSDFYVLDPGTGSACTLEAAMFKNGHKDTVYNYIQTKRN